MKKIFLIALALFLSGCGGGGDDDAATPSGITCSSFAIQERAQEYFDAHDGSVTNNVDNLDPDHDGIACENLPHRQGAPALGESTPETTGG
jgi:hypothetical protein